MRTTIDRAGRVVIPAAIRARVGLRPGAELDVLVDEGSIRLVRAVPRPKLVRVGKRLVARPTADPKRLPPVDVAALVDEERNRWPRIMAGIAAGQIRRAATAWHCCLEFYSVVTRLPEEFRLVPEDALRLLAHHGIDVVTAEEFTRSIRLDRRGGGSARSGVTRSSTRTVEMQP